MGSTAERTAVMIVRAWLEPGHASPLRATLTSRLDVEAGEERRRLAGSVDEVCEAVREWLEELLEA